MAEATATCTVGPVIIIADPKRDLFRFVRAQQHMDADTDMTNLLPFKARDDG